MNQAGEFEELARACQGELFALVLARCSNRESAKDVLQEVLLAAWQHREKLLALPGEQRRRYLFAMARNRAIDEHRRSTRQRPAMHPLPGGYELTDGLPLETDDRLETLDECLVSLAPEDRELLLLSTVGGLESQSIADRTGSKASTIRSHLTRVRRQLRECITAKIERANRVG